MNRKDRIRFYSEKLPGGWYWIMRSRTQGTIAISSKEFKSQDECEEQIEWIIKNAPYAIID